MSLGTQIRQARRRLGMTQAQLAGREFSKSFISQVERDLINPSLRSLRILSDRLGLNLAHLMSQSDTRTQAHMSILRADTYLSMGHTSRAQAELEQLDSSYQWVARALKSTAHAPTAYPPRPLPPGPPLSQRLAPLPLTCTTGAPAKPEAATSGTTPAATQADVTAGTPAAAAATQAALAGGEPFEANLVAYACAVAGEVALAQRQNDQALAYASCGLQHLEPTGTLAPLQVRLLVLLGEVYAMEGHTLRAHAVWEEAAKLVSASGAQVHPTLQTRLYRHLAHLYETAGDAEAAAMWQRYAHDVSARYCQLTALVEFHLSRAHTASHSVSAFQDLVAACALAKGSTLVIS